MPSSSTQMVVKTRSLAPSWEEEKRNFLQLQWFQKSCTGWLCVNGLDLEQVSTPELRKLAKTYQAFDKYLAYPMYKEYAWGKAFTVRRRLNGEKLERSWAFIENVLCRIKKPSRMTWHMESHWYPYINSVYPRVRNQSDVTYLESLILVADWTRLKSRKRTQQSR